MALKLYNYATHKLERFRPHDREYVGMYVCGPTATENAHLGHAKLYIFMDVVTRYLQYRAYQVRYVLGIPDICQSSSPIARNGLISRTSMPHYEVVEAHVRSFQDDMDALKMLRPSLSPRASCHISEMIAWVQQLIERGYAHEVDGEVRFSIREIPGFGKLAQSEHGSYEGQQEPWHPDDFILWRRVESGRTYWQSPWGEGSPGLHLACSVMAHKYLGETLDIHGGTVSANAFDYDCEIAQSEAHNGAPFARYWLLVGPLLVDGKKMSRSLANYLTIKDALKLYSPDAIRYFILSTHYRDALEFERGALQAAQRAISRLHRTVQHLRWRIRDSLPVVGAGTAALSEVASLEKFREEFRRAMDNDLNTPQALTVLFELVSETECLLQNGAAERIGTLSAIDKLFRDLAGRVLGILPKNLESRPGDELIEGLVEYLLTLCIRYREAGEWGQADAILSELDKFGIVVEEGPLGMTWRLQE